MSRLDEPLDMSLKSRKRSPVHEYLPKKKRASVIARSPKVDGGLPLEATEMKPKIEVDSPHQSPSMSRKSHILNDLLTGGERYERLPVTIRIPAQSFPVPHRVIINNEVEGGLEEHFRRSLCREFYVDVETEGVDAHFSRSLGHAKWEELQRTNPQESLSSSLVDLSMPSDRTQQGTN